MHIREHGENAALNARSNPPDDGRTATGRNPARGRGKPQKGGAEMPEKEKVKDVQALADTLDSLPETVKQRILGVAEGYQMAIDASKEKEGSESA